MKKAILLLLLALAFAGPTFAWVYPEHHEITARAVEKLAPSDRVVFDRLWAWARQGNESRMDATAISVIARYPKSLDFGAWTAISGDHSVSAEDMLNSVLNSDWILDVADVTARLKEGIETSKNRNDIINQLRDSDSRLLRADPDYVSRAGGNNSHFMLARPEVTITAAAFFDTCFRQGEPLNLIGVYKWYHASALLKARMLAADTLSPEMRAEVALSALADEAYAIHFLEDGFASGHVAGIWGDAAQRKGTHDYYCEHGLEVTTWDGERLVLMGDAFMRPEDADRAARTVHLSLREFVAQVNLSTSRHFNSDRPVFVTPEVYNTGKTVINPSRTIDPELDTLLDSVLMTTAVPGLVNGPGEMPRFRAEIGPFIGLTSAGRTSVYDGGYAVSQTTAGVIPALEVALRLGIGMDGVMNESGDGLLFLDLGWRQDGSSSMKYSQDPDLKYYGSITSAIPSRDAFYVRLRMPFFLIPGDLLIMSPMYLFSPKTYDKMLVTAANGGILPWQSGMMTRIGRMQFMIGREVGVCLYGTGRGPDVFLVPTIVPGGDEESVITMYSTQIDFPIFEYRPLRTFSSRQTASLVVQINAGLDIPGKRTVVESFTDGTIPEMKTAWFIGIRVAFDWRYYFAN